MDTVMSVTDMAVGEMEAVRRTFNDDTQPGERMKLANSAIRLVSALVRQVVVDPGQGFTVPRSSPEAQ